MIEKPLKGRRITQADIERLKKTLPKKGEIKADGKTEARDHGQPGVREGIEDRS